MLRISEKRRCRIREFAHMIVWSLFVPPSNMAFYIQSISRKRNFWLYQNLMIFGHWWYLFFFIWRFQIVDQYLSLKFRTNKYYPLWSSGSRNFFRYIIVRMGCVLRGSPHHGWWSEENKMNHINFLELKAAFYTLQCFAVNIRNCQILLRIDNITAIFLYRFNSIQYSHLLKLARQIWS